MAFIFNKDFRICRSVYFNLDELDRPETLIHEWMHYFFTTGDFAYSHEEAFNNNSILWQLHNADSYSNCVLQLHPSSLTIERYGEVYNLSSNLPSKFDLTDDNYKDELNSSENNFCISHINDDGQDFSRILASVDIQNLVKIESFDLYDYDDVLTSIDAFETYNSYSYTGAIMQNVTEGDMLIGIKNNNIYVIEVLQIEDENADCSCDQLGKITFKYKKESN